jgi:hypothetical protein
MRRQQYEVDRAKQLSQKFKVSIAMPFIRPEPPGFSRRDDFFQPRNIRAGTIPFQPGSQHPNTFHDVWERILQFARGEFFQEHHFMRVLGFVLHGDALRTFNDLEAAGHGFKYILETLADIYATKRTLLEDQKAVDDFIRLKEEALDIAMKRCGILVERLRPMYDDLAWPEIHHRMMRGVLKQIISAKTRRHVDLYEKGILKEGGHVAVTALISMAQVYEESHDEVPKKDNPTVFQTASGEPKIWMAEAAQTQSELKHLKKQQSQSKSFDQKYGDLLNVAAAVLKRHPSLDNRKKNPLHLVQKRSRDNSTSSQGNVTDTDVEMKNAVPLPSTSFRSQPTAPTSTRKYQPNYPDKKPRADNKERGRSRDRNFKGKSGSTPYHSADKRSGSTGSQRDRGSQSRPRSGSQESRSGSSSRTQPTTATIINGRLPPDMPVVVNRGVQYWICHACPAFHKPTDICPFLAPTEN